MNHPHIFTIAFIALVVVGVDSCTAMKPIARTINDVAQQACEVAFAADADQIPQGVTVKEFCEAHDNLQPFIRQILAAKKAVGETHGMSSDGNPVTVDAGGPD